LNYRSSDGKTVNELILLPAYILSIRINGRLDHIWSNILSWIQLNQIIKLGLQDAFVLRPTRILNLCFKYYQGSSAGLTTSKRKIMEKLNSFQRKHLKGLAHSIKPVVFIGRNGLTPAICLSAEKALDQHELIKVKFIDFKEKDQKNEIAGVLESETGSEVVGIIGHAVILYRRQSDPEKRRIELPGSKP